jgi:hypothetical protein
MMAPAAPPGSEGLRRAIAALDVAPRPAVDEVLRRLRRLEDPPVGMLLMWALAS